VRTQQRQRSRNVEECARGNRSVANCTLLVDQYFIDDALLFAASIASRHRGETIQITASERKERNIAQAADQ
jgi:hypothetical protein